VIEKGKVGDALEAEKRWVKGECSGESLFFQVHLTEERRGSTKGLHPEEKKGSKLFVDPPW